MIAKNAAGELVKLLNDEAHTHTGYTPPPQTPLLQTPLPQHHLTRLSPKIHHTRLILPRSTRDIYHTHLRRPLPRQKNTRFPCPEKARIGCNVDFSTQSHATRHARIHSDNRPFACRNCERRFDRRDNLRQHEQKGKPCDYSTRTIRSRTALENLEVEVRGDANCLN